MAPYTNKKSNPKYILWIVLLVPILVIIGVYLYRFLKQQATNIYGDHIAQDVERSQAENKDPIIAQTKADKITTSKDIQAAARQLAYALGTHISVLPDWMDAFDPTGWTENDKEAATIVIKWSNPKNFDKLSKLYTTVYSAKRSDLRSDLLRLLDSDQLARVRKYVKV